MLLAEQNERNVVTQLKEMLRLSPALSLYLSLPLSFPLSRWTSLSPLPLPLSSFLSPFKTTSRSALPRNVLATHTLAFCTDFTFCKMYAQDTETIHIYGGNGGPYSFHSLPSVTGPFGPRQPAQSAHHYQNSSGH